MVESSTHDLSQELSNMENNIKRQNESLDVVNQEYSDVKKKLVDLDIQKKQLEIKRIDLAKYREIARHNLENSRLAYEKLKRDFFACQREGR